MNKDNTFINALGGEIDHHCAVKIRHELDGMILEERPQVLIFDFSNVRFMDSSGIGLVLGRYRLMATLGGKVIVNGSSKEIARIFKMSGVDKIVEIN